MAAVLVYCGSSTALDPAYLDLATETGRELARRGHTLVSGGGRVGMMGAVAEGARSLGAHTLGIIPQSLVDLEVADTASDELLVTTSMNERKDMMLAKSDAIITLPGGLGTLDELFEVWTTATLGLHRKPIVLLDPDGYYAGLLAWLRTAMDARFVRPAALDLVVLATSVPAAFDALDAPGTRPGPDETAAAKE